MSGREGGIWHKQARCCENECLACVREHADVGRFSLDQRDLEFYWMSLTPEVKTQEMLRWIFENAEHQSFTVVGINLNLSATNLLLFIRL